MNAELIKAASEVVHNHQILVNIVSRRVRQLSLGHRPLVEFAPGMGHADVALTEIANGKRAFESGPTRFLNEPPFHLRGCSKVLVPEVGIEPTLTVR